MTDNVAVNSGSLEYNPEGFSLQIFKDRYAFIENETWYDACKRVRFERDYPNWRCNQ